jgi:choline dehydrogenase-like flavoprotein
MAHFQQSAEELFRRAGGETMSGMGQSGPVGFPGAPGSPDRPLHDAATAGETKAKSPHEALSGVIHEVGTARMSADPRTGVLDPFCRTHDIPNLYVFGGNAFCSTGDKHPTLTMMALTARGCDHLLKSAKDKKV